MKPWTSICSHFTLLLFILLQILDFSIALECNECIIISSEGQKCKPLPKSYLKKLKSDDEALARATPGNYTKICQTIQLDRVSLSESSGQGQGSTVNVVLRLSQMWEETKAKKYERACAMVPIATEAKSDELPLFKDLFRPNSTFYSGEYYLCSCRDKDFCNTDIDISTSSSNVKRFSFSYTVFGFSLLLLFNLF